MKVFTDLHHGDLYYSLHLLFEQRLGWELYRPIGLDWFHGGFWKIAEPYNNAMDTVGQYLAINQCGWDSEKNLNGNNYVEDGVYYVHEPVHNYYQKAITLEKFRSMNFDIILPTIKAHDYSFERLRDMYQSQAKLVSQMGNTGQGTHLKNAMHTTPYKPEAGQNTVYYHQEIDPNLYSYIQPNSATKNIFSVTNCYPYSDIYLKYKQLIPEVNWKFHGGGCPDGGLFGAKGVGEKMREANIGWHLKPQGGLGHSAMSWMASGRPVITNMSQHRNWDKPWGGDATKLFEPGVTCYDIEGSSEQDNVAAIRHILEPEENLRMAENAYKRFHELISYDEEEKKIREFLGRLL
jgi:hypothetical protein